MQGDHADKGEKLHKRQPADTFADELLTDESDTDQARKADCRDQEEFQDIPEDESVDFCRKHGGGSVPNRGL